MDSQGKVRAVVWPAVFPSALLLRTLRTSFRLSVIGAAFSGYLLTILGGWFVGAVLFSDAEDPLVERWHRDFTEQSWGSGRGLSSLGHETGDLSSPSAGSSYRQRGRDPRSADGFASTPLLMGNALLDRAVDAPASGWWCLTGPVVRLFHPRLSVTALSYLLLRNGWNVLVWALFGGAIARIAAVDLARREAIGAAEGISHAIRQFPSLVLAPLLVGLAIVLVALPLIVAGVLIRVDALAWIAGMVWLAVLVAGLLLSVVAIGAIAGWPLLWAASAVERSDAFDAVSRAYAYVYQRPLHLLAYAFSAAVLVAIGAGLFYLFAGTTVLLADWAIGWGSGAENLEALQGIRNGAGNSLWLQAAAGRRFWIRLVAVCMEAYPIGFLFTAAVAIYLLMRLRVDAAELDEIVDDQREALGGLPELEPHPSGVPEMRTP